MATYHITWMSGRYTAEGVQLLTGITVNALDVRNVEEWFEYTHPRFTLTYIATVDRCDSAIDIRTFDSAHVLNVCSEQYSAVAMYEYHIIYQNVLLDILPNEMFKLEKRKLDSMAMFTHLGVQDKVRIYAYNKGVIGSEVLWVPETDVKVKTYFAPATIRADKFICGVPADRNNVSLGGSPVLITQDESGAWDMQGLSCHPNCPTPETCSKAPLGNCACFTGLMGVPAEYLGIKKEGFLGSSLDEVAHAKAYFGSKPNCTPRSPYGDSRGYINFISENRECKTPRNCFRGGRCTCITGSCPDVQTPDEV